MAAARRTEVGTPIGESIMPSEVQQWIADMTRDVNAPQPLGATVVGRTYGVLAGILHTRCETG